MAVFRCKMCGGDLEVLEESTICECEFCGTKQTLPKAKDENLQSLFNRANVLRMKSEFDKAADIYEKILQKDETEAEAYWGLILCKYGIEYVEDPATFKRVPTCHRASYDAVTADEDYKNAIKYADAGQKNVYEEQAAAIDEIQKGIIALAQKEDPYDVFICYKETDENGNRTQDSVIANDIYYQLKQEGFKVFYAAITLEDKLGSEYEPHIFSALNTAKVMLALGTKPEYFNAVWVKNEWSRFLKIMKKDRSKMLIPCYRDMDPYELPEEFSHLQAQNMSKIGFINDIVRGIKKVVVKETEKPAAQETIVQQSTGNTTVSAQLDRGNMALEDHEWDKADSFFEEALNLDPRCAEAYIGKLLTNDRKPGIDSWVAMQKEKYSSAQTERLTACQEDSTHINDMVRKYVLGDYLDADTIRKLYKYDRGYDSVLSCRKNQKSKQQGELAGNKYLNRAQQYAAGATKQKLAEGLAVITKALDQRIAEAEEQDKASIERVTAAYTRNVDEADHKAEELRKYADHRKDDRYNAAVEMMKKAEDIPAYEKARDDLKSMNGYKDSKELSEKCQKEIDRITEEKCLADEKAAAEKARLEAAAAKEAAKKAKKKKVIIGTLCAAAVVVVVIAVVMTQIIIPNNKRNEAYNEAVALKDSGKYEDAIAAFEAMDGYMDSADQIPSIKHSSEYINGLEVGGTFLMGNYENEDIEWRILAKEEDRVLVISKKGLDSIPYNTEYEDTTWENCSLRKWLNSDFIDQAFSDTEKTAIMSTTITADANPDYDTDSGNDTEDQVFLLSINEVDQYFTSDADRVCYPTDYAEQDGAYTSDKGACSWWLRSPGYLSRSAADVDTDGSVYADGYYVSNDDDCIRPAFWLDLSNLKS